MTAFDGTVVVSQNPVTLWERYNTTLKPLSDSGWLGKGLFFSRLSKEERAEGGFWECRFTMHGPEDDLKEFMTAGLGRDVKVYSGSGRLLGEYFIYSMTLVKETVSETLSLQDTWNRIWLRYRVTGSSTPVSSTVQEDTVSVARFGKKELVVGAGELESSGIADAKAQQMLALKRWPKPDRVFSIGSGGTKDPVLQILCKGYIETLRWQCYNFDTAGNQGASAQISDIIAAKGQFVATSVINSNSTLVTKKYNTDRRALDIVLDIARLGDATPNRWVIGMYEARTFMFNSAAPPTLPPSV